VTDLRNGRYTLLCPLGEGSQAETWEARDNGASGSKPDPANLARDFDTFVRRAKGESKHHPSARGLVAIKCFRVGRAKAWKDVELAEREATTLATLDHPNLPKYVEHFEEDGALYLVMEKIEGDALVPAKTRSVDVVRMLEDIGAALHYLHGLSPSLVHRDVKPGNILRRPDGSYALVDLGAVRDRLKPAGGSTVVGTFGYMAPEQFQGRASPQSDLYGLGATALAMITGRQPEDLPHQGLGIDVKASLPRGTRRALAKALTAMLEPDPNDRAESIDEVLALLRSQKTEQTAKKKRRKTRRKERRARTPRQRAPRDPSASPGWTFANLAVVFAMVMAYWAYHRWYVLVIGGLLIAALGKLRRASVREPPPPGETASQVRVAERREDQARVRVAAEETYEAEVDEAEDEETGDKLRR
jgi:serine/threonine protein kinase